MTDIETSFLDKFGFTMEELERAKEKVSTRARNPMHMGGRRFLGIGAPGALAGFQNIFAKHWSPLFSETGLALYIMMTQSSPHLLQDTELVATHLLNDPVAFRDATAWCLFFAARDASLGTQMNCMAPRSESHLSGGLLESLKHGCREWSTVIDAPLERRASVLTLDFIDHSILGGEQATGGDFAVILDIDGNGLQPGQARLPSDQKIIPLLFQAKRYVRPNADVSQKHHKRGYQHSLLGRNDCRSAYIFYENETKDLSTGTIRTPFPPLLKDVRQVAAPTSTAVLEDSTDLATFLMTSFADDEIAPRAETREQALRMVFDKAEPGQLCRLAIIASEADAYRNYFDILNSFGPDEKETVGIEI